MGGNQGRCVPTPAPPGPVPGAAASGRAAPPDHQHPLPCLCVRVCVCVSVSVSVPGCDTARCHQEPREGPPGEPGASPALDPPQEAEGPGSSLNAGAPEGSGAPPEGSGPPPEGSGPPPGPERPREPSLTAGSAAPSAPGPPKGAWSVLALEELVGSGAPGGQKVGCNSPCSPSPPLGHSALQKLTQTPLRPPTTSPFSTPSPGRDKPQELGTHSCHTA